MLFTRTLFQAFSAAVALCLLLSGGIEARSLAQSQPTTDEVAQLFDTWNAALQTGNPDDVVALYDPEDGVLLPTLSNDIRTDPEAIRDYFVEFLSKQPNGRIVESYISIDGPIITHSGAYIFDLGVDNTSVPARFTYVYRRGAEGKWLILNHHSSAMPEEGYEAPVDSSEGGK